VTTQSTQQTKDQANQMKDQAGQMKEQAGQAGSQMKEGAKDTAKQIADQTRDAWSQVQDEPTPSGLQSALESLPASSYMYAALGSIGLSMLLRLLGRKEFANFVGLWPPTIVALALLNKQVRPSKEMP
jgi:hypothetical protein